MIYICLPVHDEAPTLGPLLWKLRTIMTAPEFRRDFHVLVLDDGSTDDTARVLDRYRSQLPLTVVREELRLGYGRAVDRLLREVVRLAPYPKRDAAVVLQADFTESPEAVAALVRTLEGGADIVAGEPLEAPGETPRPRRWARRLAPLVLGRAHGRAPVQDPLCGLRAYRIIVLKKALKDDQPFCSSPEPWGASLELLARTAPHARRIESTGFESHPRRAARASRFRAVRALRSLLPLRGARWVAGLLAVLLSSGFAAPVWAQAQNPAGLTLPETVLPTAPPAVPFEPGERLTYKVKLGIMSVGEGHMTVHGVEEIRGAPTYHVSMDLDAAIFWVAKVKDEFHSWMDVRTLASRQFIKNQREVNYSSYKAFDIFPEERRWARTDEYDDKTGESPSDAPMDEIAFIYFLRTLPLEVGDVYEFDRYFKEDGNPVVVKVLRKEVKKVDAGTFETIVVQPIIKTRGLFSEGGEAELYFSDDADRHLVYMRSNVPVVGSITLHLKRIEQGVGAGDSSGG